MAFKITAARTHTRTRLLLVFVYSNMCTVFLVPLENSLKEDFAPPPPPITTAAVFGYNNTTAGLSNNIQSVHTRTKCPQSNHSDIKVRWWMLKLDCVSLWHDYFNLLLVSFIYRTLGNDWFIFYWPRQERRWNVKGGGVWLVADQRDLTIRTNRDWSASVMH